MKRFFAITKTKGILALILALNVFFSAAQDTENLIVNGGMDGEPGDSNFPTSWYACDSWSSPDIYNEYKPKLTGSGTIIPFRKTPPFVFLRTRGKDRKGFEYTYEYIAEKLAKPLMQDSIYDFTAYYCFNAYQELAEDTNRTFIMSPVRLELWAGNDSCAEDKLIMQTEPLSATFWTQKRCTFIPDTSYTYIRVVATWDSMTQSPDHRSYEGMILLDDLSIRKSENELVPKKHDLIFKGDKKTTLLASEGTSYSWVPQKGLDYYNIQNPVMQSYDSVYTVFIGSLTSCSSVEKFFIQLICDTLHPERERDTAYFDYDPNMFLPLLPMDEGIKFKWDPSDKLIMDSGRPRLTEYDSSITITITDKYGCEFKRKYTFGIDCDKIVTEKNQIVLNTTIQKNTSVNLIPTSTNIIRYWEPQVGLTCTECFSPYASPNSSTTYTVDIMDETGCVHTESFIVGVDLFIPNIITPNGDGINDFFEISGLPDNTALRIYDKAGYLLYSVNSYTNNSWNGSKNDGTLLETETYWYVLENKAAGLFKKGFIYVKR